MSVIDDLPQRSLSGSGRDGYWDLTSLPGSEREAGFEELVSATHVDMAVRIDRASSAASFQAWGRRRPIHDLALVEAGCDPCDGMRGKRRAARTDDLFLGVTVLRRGRETLVLGDTTTEMRPGDAVVWRSDQPIRFQVHTPQVKQTLIVPMSALAEMSGGKRLCGPLFLDRAAPSTQLFAGYLGLVSRTMDQLSAPEMCAARSAALELFVAAARGHGIPAAGGATEPPIAALQDWIEQRLPSEGVTAMSIAAAHGMSVRGVYRAFEEAGETVGAFVRARRLARARRDLAAGVGSIADVAARWGFSDPSHFARAFRAEYDCSPRDYRAAAMKRP
ncbi:helix-turn-helix domain-containing protein [Rhodococcus sp. IEGM 248]|nr:helix-turn-helix domain-containing protein [Rhodococcus sp. IEGM 248]RZI53660.1 MAG: helix-turn-helix domain-containing protein [Pseudonocardia sp.]TQC42242.1 helix-turn-helix domain-containing protein [Rhodococcus sp. WS4]